MHCIILFDTDVYNPDILVDDLNLSNGLITKDEFNWALKEIDSNKDKLCIIFTHHPLSTFFPTTDLNPWLENGSEMQAALQRRHNFVAWICGHTHINQIESMVTSDGWGFWSITTCSLIDYPSEWRQLIIKDQGNGIGVITTNMFERQLVLEANGTNVADVQKSKCSDTSKAYGEAGDRNTELYFKMAPEVAQNIKAQ